MSPKDERTIEINGVRFRVIDERETQGSGRLMSMEEATAYSKGQAIATSG